MNIETQREQWPHRVAMLRAAAPNMVTVYHGTHPDIADKIIGTQSWLPGNGGWFSTDPERARAYGPAVISTQMPRSKVPGPRSNPEFYVPHQTRLLRTGPFQSHTASRIAAFDPYEANDYGIEPYHEQDWEDDEDEGDQDGYIRQNNPVRLKSPLYPDGHKSRPSFSDDLDDLGGNRTIYHFPPHDFNPPSDSPARGDAYWPRYRKKPPEGVLPLDLPDMAMPNMPTDRDPIPLYRGISLRLDHPDLQWIRRALHGNRREDIEDNQLTPGARWSPHFTDRDRVDGYYFGQPSRQPYLDPSMTNKALADPKEEGDTELLYNSDAKHRMTHSILDHMHDQKGGLGTHWGMEEGNARSFADSGGTGNHTSPSLPVVITHNWMGTGEDPYRRKTEGEWPDEQEITHLHGAKANVSAVHVKHPHHGWMKIFDADDHGETLTHQASR